jgi:putative hydrolase
MLEVDLHSHTLFSRCGLHTIVEMLDRARVLGMKGLAITDRSTALDGWINGNFFWRLKDPVDGIRMLKGIECNLLEDRGEIDLPRDHVPHMDVVLLGIHYNVPSGQGRDRYAEMLLAAMEANPQVDILTHPHLPDHELDMKRIAEACRKNGVAMELNNSKCPPGSEAVRRMSELINICMEGCKRKPR